MSVKYIAVNFFIVSLPKPTFNGRLTSETGSGLKYPLELLESPIYIAIIVFQGGDDGRGYRNIYKLAGGRNLI